MKILFIGGPADGEWREVEYLADTLRVVDLPVGPAPCAEDMVDLPDVAETVRFHETIYRLEKLQDQRGRYLVYVALDGSLIETLLNGYKP